jgi:hypothetical protein
MSEYIVGLTYTFTVYPKRTDLETWFKSYDVKGREVELDLYYSVPGYAENFLIDRGKIHTDENGNIVEETVTYTGKFNHVGSISLLLRAIPPDVYRGYGTVSVRYPRLTIQITDEKGSPLEGVECLAYPEGWVSPLRGETDRNGIAVIDLRGTMGEPILDKRIRVFARKSGYDKYPDYTSLGSAPSPIEMGGDTAITGVLHSTGVAPPPTPPPPPPPPPTPITVYFEVYDAYTGSPLADASISVDTTPAVTDAKGMANVTLPSTGTYTVRVSKPGYRDWSESLSLVDGGRVIVRLTPQITLPKITLTVDRTSIVEGESIVFTVSPSDLDVDLHEIVNPEKYPEGYVYIKTFRGSTTLQPTVGKHDYAVKYTYRYGSYSSDIWSNIVTVTVEAKPTPPPTPPPTPTPPTQLPTVTLSVDKSVAVEGEPVKFTVTPSDVEVELYEVAVREGALEAVERITTFKGETTVTPPVGDHMYAVKPTATGLSSLLGAFAGLVTTAVTLPVFWSNPVALKVMPKPPPPPPTLTVDRPAVFEGETIKLTVTPSDVEVELYEVVGAERKFIQRFTGELTLKPEVGSHTYIVKHDEQWSNPVVVVVSPKPVTPPPAPILSVDKPVITEGESIKLTVTPSDIEVELYEIVGAERRYIERFMGEATITPTVGTHAYIVKHDEAWSNFVTVYVSPKPPTPTPPTPTPAKPEAKPNWNVAVTVSVGGEPVGLGEAEVELREATPWQLERHNYGPVLTDPNGVAYFTGVAGAYYVDGEKYSDMTYEVIARLRVEKKGVPAGSILRASLILEDGGFRVLSS